jgi:carbamate kinase
MKIVIALAATAGAGGGVCRLRALPAGRPGRGHAGMIGYLIQQELRCLLPPEQQVATPRTMITLNPAHPALAHPSKFVASELLAEDVAADLIPNDHQNS